MATKYPKNTGSCPSSCSCWNSEGSKESVQVVSCPGMSPSQRRHQGSKYPRPGFPPGGACPRGCRLLIFPTQGADKAVSWVTGGTRGSSGDGSRERCWFGWEQGKGMPDITPVPWQDCTASDMPGQGTSARVLTRGASRGSRGDAGTWESWQRHLPHSWGDGVPHSAGVRSPLPMHPKTTLKIGRAHV